MRECDNSRIHVSSNFPFSICLLIKLDTLLLVPSLHYNTSLNFTQLHFTTLIDTSLHLSTLHFLPFTLHYPLIWLNPFTFPIDLFHLTSLNQTQYSSHIPQLISKIMNPFPALKNLSPFHFTLYFLHLFYQPFTPLYFAIRLYNSLAFTSLRFTFNFSWLVVKLLPMQNTYRTFRPSPSWNIMQRTLQLFTDVWGQPIGPIFRSRTFLIRM